MLTVVMPERVSTGNLIPSSVDPPSTKYARDTTDMGKGLSHTTFGNHDTLCLKSRCCQPVSKGGEVLYDD